MKEISDSMAELHNEEELIIKNLIEIKTKRAVLGSRKIKLRDEQIANFKVDIANERNLRQKLENTVLRLEAKINSLEDSLSIHLKKKMVPKSVPKSVPKLKSVPQNSPKKLSPKKVDQHNDAKCTVIELGLD